MFRRTIRNLLVLLFALAAVCVCIKITLAKDEPANPDETAIRAAAAQFATAFNAGKAKDLAGEFLSDAELIDDEGNQYQGEKELGTLIATYFEKFPDAKLQLEVESVRTFNKKLAIEEGTRVITSGKTKGRAQVRYTTVWSKGDDGKWRIASIREFANDPTPSPHERLEGLDWLVGDWVSEGTDGLVKISYKWSDDKNYLLGDFDLNVAGKDGGKSSQRIGWDPLTGKIRSWLFDADGGYSNGLWTATDEGFVIKSSSVNPDGNTASATMAIITKDKSHFTMKGTERIVGDSREPDFEVAIVKKPPAKQ